MNNRSSAPLSSAEISKLEDILFDERFVEDALDYFGIHGMLSALAVGPVELSSDEWVSQAFGQPVAADSLADYALVKSYLERTFRHIRAALNGEEQVELPAETYEDRDALTNWCAGFVEAFMAHEAEWFADRQDLVAELLLPIMAVSDLFDDEDFTQIKANPKLMEQLSEQIPEVLTDLYLLFHAQD